LERKREKVEGLVTTGTQEREEAIKEVDKSKEAENRVFSK